MSEYKYNAEDVIAAYRSIGYDEEARKAGYSDFPAMASAMFSPEMQGALEAEINTVRRGEEVLSDSELWVSPETIKHLEWVSNPQLVEVRRLRILATVPDNALSPVVDLPLVKTTYMFGCLVAKE